MVLGIASVQLVSTPTVPSASMEHTMEASTVPEPRTDSRIVTEAVVSTKSHW